jgi:hypothetical protein
LIAPLYARYHEGLDSLDLAAARTFVDGSHPALRH